MTLLNKYNINIKSTYFFFYPGQTFAALQRNKQGFAPTLSLLPLCLFFSFLLCPFFLSFILYPSHHKLPERMVAECGEPVFHTSLHIIKNIGAVRVISEIYDLVGIDIEIVKLVRFPECRVPEQDILQFLSLKPFIFEIFLSLVYLSQRHKDAKKKIKIFICKKFCDSLTIKYNIIQT